jgi:dolichyl-phosphate-mannose-protein mannosyltransferase
MPTDSDPQDRSRLTLWDWCCLPGLSLFAAAVNMHYARLGFMPLDQCTVFDGGWRILSGLVPFRDFTMLTGIVPSVLQAAFFAVFGVSWWSYCLHASLFNAAFCGIVFLTLRKIGASRGVALTASALSAICYYPVSGTPYLEHHGIFFILVAVALLLTSRDRSNEWARRLSWAGAGLAVVFAFFCKQNIPALFSPAVFFAASYSWRDRRSILVSLQWMTLGTLVGVAFFAATGALVGVSWELFRIDFIDQALSKGGKRLSRMVSDVQPVLEATAFALFTAAMAYWLLRRARTPAGRSPMAQLSLLFCGAALLGCGTILDRTTLNQDGSGWGFRFMALAMIYLLASEAASSKLSRAATYGLTLLVAALLLWRTSLSVRMRWFHDIDYSEEMSASLTTPELRFLRFQTNWMDLQNYHAEDLDRVVAFLKQQPRNFLLVGDSSLLYGVTGRISVNPQLYFHGSMRNEYFQKNRKETYQQELLSNMRRYDVGFVVLEGEHTWTRMSIKSFPVLEREVTQRAVRKIDFGWFQVIELE